MADHEHAGHRKRLLAKLDSGALEVHEYLEALLFNAIPRMNTNDIAHRLLSRFGSIQDVLQASVEELQSVKGIGENVAQYIRLIGKVFQIVTTKEEDRLFPRKFVEQEFISFLKDYYKDADNEYLDFFFLDEKEKIKQVVRFTSEQEHSVDIATDQLEKVFALNHPAAIIISHNHVKGSCMPSETDEVTTCKIQMMCHLQNIRFCDHFIVSPVDVFSYHGSGRLAAISKEYAPNKIIEKIRELKPSLAKKFY